MKIKAAKMSSPVATARMRDSAARLACSSSGVSPGGVASDGGVFWFMCSASTPPTLVLGVGLVRAWGASGVEVGGDSMRLATVQGLI